MHRKFNYDIFARFLVIMENVVILYIKEYIGPTMTPPCDVIDDIIIMKILFGIIWDDFFIYEVKLKLCLMFQNFQNSRHFELAFLPEVFPTFRAFDRRCNSNIGGDISI